MVIILLPMYILLELTTEHGLFAIAKVLVNFRASNLSDYLTDYLWIFWANFVFSRSKYNSVYAVQAWHSSWLTIHDWRRKTWCWTVWKRRWLMEEILSAGVDASEKVWSARIYFCRIWLTHLTLESALTTAVHWTVLFIYFAKIIN